MDTDKKKLDENSDVLLNIGFWSSRLMRRYTGITVHFISN